MRILAFPKSGISYNDCYYQAIEAKGGQVVEGMFTGGWFASNVRAGDWVHLHWPSFEYGGARGSLRVLMKLCRFVALLVLARGKGARLVWTAHNLLPHDRTVPTWVDTFARHVVIGLSDVILVHGQEAGAVLQERFPKVRGKVTVIPHGHWVGYYRTDISPLAARERLGIPTGAFVYLFIGLCKPYKNLDGLIQSFRKSGGDAILVIAGKFQDQGYYAKILDLAQGDPRIMLFPGFVANDDMQVYLHACNVVVVPYREILTSGTAILAMSFGRPVISVAMGFLRDVVNDDAGLLFAANDPEGLSKAILDVRRRDFVPARILAHVARFSFAEAAELTLRVLGSSDSSL